MQQPAGIGTNDGARRSAPQSGRTRFKLRFKLRLRTQLILLYGVVAALVYVFSIFGIHYSVENRFEEFSQREDERRQTDFVRLIASFVSDDEALSPRAVRGAMRRFGVRDVRIYNLRGILLLDTSDGGGREESSRTFPSGVPGGESAERGEGARGPRETFGSGAGLREGARFPGGGESGDAARLAENSLREYRAALQADDREVGSMVFTAHVRRPGAFVERFFMDDVRSTLLVVSVTAIFLLCGISWWVSRSIARPLESASKAAARIAGGAQGALDARLETAGAFSAREVTALLESFNGMADALQLKESLRTRMTSDIAHELRTPVSVLKAHLEGLRDEVLPMDTAALSSLLDETARLEKIINDLRAIWELENTGLSLHCVALDVRPFMERVAERFRPLAQEKGMRLDLYSAGPDADVRVLADSAALNRVFDNLLQNALKYGRENGRIEIAVGMEGDEASGAEGFDQEGSVPSEPWIRPDAEHRASDEDGRGRKARVCIRVLDDGPGISEDALPKIFERFYRADEARARKSGGAGLGLAIAREAVEACGGSIQAANRGTEPGCVFSVYLPAAQR